MQASTLLWLALGCGGTNTTDGAKRPGVPTDLSTTTGSVITGTGQGHSDTDPLPAPACDLLENPSAELGIAGWSVVEGELVSLGADPAPVPFEGVSQFAMGSAPFSMATQTLDLDPWLGAVDDGDVVAHLQAHVRDTEGLDQVWLGLAALDENGDVVAETLEGPFAEANWRLQRSHLNLPVAARSLQVQIGGTRQSGTVNDATVDALSLCLDREEGPTLEAPSAGPWLMHSATDGMSVLWTTEAVVTGAIEYREAGGQWIDTVSGGNASDHHEVRLTGLMADTTYDYRIRFGEETGEIYSFRTAPGAAVPFRFTVWGDNQSGPDVFAEVVDRMETLDPDFALAVGDVVETGTENNWHEQLLDPILDLTLDTPFLVAAGNHERLLDGSATNFDLHMAQPGDEHCFSWTYGGAFFLFIDTENPVDSGDQLQCITDALASPEFATSDVQFAAFHYPPRIEYWAFFTFDGLWPYDGDPEVRDVLEPQLAAAGVDLVLNGHNHLYAYTPSGTYSSVAWVTTGGGGGDIDTSGWGVGTWDGITETRFDHHFLHVEVNGKTIDVDAVDLDGLLMHEFTIQAD